MTEILPTHTCFDDAIQNLIFLMESRGRHIAGRMKVVHAIIEPEGAPLSHAWIELDRRVFFSGILKGETVMVETDLAEYYRQSRIKVLRRYSIWAAYAEEQRTGRYGPWDPRIQVFVND